MDSIKTIKGYDMFEVVSAFQKEIRRGNEMEAMFWGVELYESGFIPYAWKRMMVMSTEDVGLANPNAPMIINALKQQYDLLYSPTDKRQQQRLPYTQAILFLVNTPKTRHTDWALNYHWDTHFEKESRLEIPDYALDIHTRRGKIMGKTIVDFFEAGSIINNEQFQENTEFYKNTCRERWTNKTWNDKIKVDKAERSRIKEGWKKNGGTPPATPTQGPKPNTLFE